jgi:hypothetical protein
VLDEKFFSAMDNLSRWFPLPYPRSLEEIHHRQSFHVSEGPNSPHRTQHTKVCTQLNELLATSGGPN